MDDKLHLNLIKLEEELLKLKNAVNYIESAEKITKLATDLIKEFNSLKKPFTDLAESSEKLLKEMDKVDFHNKFNETNSILYRALEELANIQKNLVEVINQNNLKLISVFGNEINELKKENKKNTIMIVVGLILILSGIFVLIIG